MKFLLKIFFSACILLAAVSCSKEKSKVQNTPGDSIHDDAGLSLENKTEAASNDFEAKNDFNVQLDFENQVELNLPEAIDPFALHKNLVDQACYGFPAFYLYGFSKDSKVCYSTLTFIDGRGGCIIEYFIQDLISDEILWNIKDDSLDWPDEGEGINDAAEYSFRLKKEELENAVKKFLIIPAELEYLQFPTKEGIECYAQVKNLVQESDSQEYFLGKIGYKISAKKADGKSKTIASKDSAQAYNAFVCGYFKSPYENRAAVLYATQEYVFEGSALFYKIAGCLLDEESFTQ